MICLISSKQFSNYWIMIYQWIDKSRKKERYRNSINWYKLRNQEK